ncbi:MAG: ATP-dependent DNA ligase [Chloroherpetonaceae bacterium]|nr:ATP-dependent DNA ligase [Chloroherpetonaceae bacterium]
MRRFAELIDRLDATTSTKEKTALLKAYLLSVTEQDAAWAVYLFLGKRHKRVLTSRDLLTCFLLVMSAKEIPMPSWLIDECQAAVGDTAEMISLLLQTVSQRGADFAQISPTKSTEEESLAVWMEERIPALAKQTEARRAETLAAWWAGRSQRECFVLNKLITGGFRIGVETLIQRALAEAYEVDEALVAERLFGDFEPRASFLHSLKIPSTEHLTPYPFYLASPLDLKEFETENPLDFAAEWKWDGIRGQLVKRGNAWALWSRDGNLLTQNFPDFASLGEALPSGTVLDGEVVVWREGAIRPFQQLQTRISRKKIRPADLKDSPAAFIAYDCLEWEGKDVRQNVFIERRKLLEEIIVAHSMQHPRLQLSPLLKFATIEALHALWLRAKEEKAEGLMLKRKNSAYLFGRKRGDWWKYKVKPMTLDAVLIYAQAGRGGRAGLFTDYTFALWNEAKTEHVTFAKAYSGLSNDEIRELDKWIRANTKERFGPARAVEPLQVFEIAFEGIGPSKRHKSGIAVRFPRILRWRLDKSAGEADSLVEAKALMKLF